MLRRALLLFVGLVFAVPVLASPPLPAPPPPARPPCLDPGKPYRATWISGRDIMVTATLGKVRPTMKVSTTCISLDRSARISVSAAASCLATGDTVTIKRVGDLPQTCRIGQVTPMPPEAPPQRN
ncbi:MAG: hypothetical protein JO167_04375 [Alphaproteobacteria bacterium]|nr:hypothetical protein [Alphaproteobacteria bacterium]